MQNNIFGGIKMGFFDKLFGSKATKMQKSNDADTNEILKKQIQKSFFIEKYKQMESEGKIIDWSCVYETNNSIYPYPCATEAEKRLFEDDKYHQLLNGDANSIVSAIISYVADESFSNNTKLTVHKDLDKVNYWCQRLVSGAYNGNRSYQAVLIRAWGYEEVWNKNRNFYIEKYKENLLADAQNGDPHAQYAVAQFEIDGATEGSEKRKEYLENAAKSGLGDAYHLLARDFEKTVDIKYGDENSCYFYSLYLKGANCNNGAFAGHMQDWIADCFYNGECGLPKDINKALYYYRLAAKNGSKTAKNSLEILKF